MVEIAASTLVSIVSLIIGLLVVIVGGLIRVLNLQARMGERLDTFQRDLGHQNQRLANYERACAACTKLNTADHRIMVTDLHCAERMAAAHKVTQITLDGIISTLREIRDALRLTQYQPQGRGLDVSLSAGTLE